ncbi:MAG: hypothetical protein N3B12_05405 [Armatimonadetes bacterium]|nr:hypothetical protein [Armatimonadota bacterium]
MKKNALTILISVLTLAQCGTLGSQQLSGATLGHSITDRSAIVGRAYETPKEIGVPASEVLKGNGSRAGYILGHGNIIPGSEWVFIGVRRARPNVDYTIDYVSGSLFFAEPVRVSDSVRVDYRYSETANTERGVAGPGTMPFLLGSSFRSNLTYSYRAADPTKPGMPDILTYGINTTTTLGSSSLTSLMYVATPQTAKRLSLDKPMTESTNTPTVKRDRIVVQDADLSLGKVVRLKLGYQDVGRDFAGFASLRESKAVSDDVLNTLEKEKGIKRTSIAAEIPTGNNEGLTFLAGIISDGNDTISSRAFGFSSSMFKMDFLNRDVGKDFARFKDIRESDRAQLAAEAGAKRTSYGMSLVTGSKDPNNPVWSSTRFVRLENETGDLKYHYADIDFGNIKIHSDTREMSPSFNMMAALSDEERTRMALIARRQFDPNAKESDVAAQDKTQINNEAGLNRHNLGFEWAGNPGKAWLRMERISSPNGRLVRRDVSFDGKGYSLYFNAHTIDEGFDRISHIQAVEQARFGNEHGMRRTEAGGTFKLSVGELAVSHAGVIDSGGADVVRRSLNFNSSRVKFRANFQDIDPRFSRINDLSDTDREMLLREKGFKRSDYALNLQAAHALNIDSYIYDSTSLIAEQTRSQNRHRITYAPKRGPQVTALFDEFSYVSHTQSISEYSQRNITFDNRFRLLGGISFKGMHDVKESRDKDSQPTTTEITQMHMESDQNAPTSYTIDTLQKDFGDNHRFEDTWEVGLKTQVAPNLKLTGGYSRSAREDDNSEVNARFGFDWKVRNDLSMSLQVNNRDGGPQGSRQSKQLTMKGLLARKFLMFRDVSVDSGVNETQLKGKQISCDNGLKMTASVFGGIATLDNSDKLNPKNGIYYTSRIVQYQSDPDPNKRFHISFFKQNLITPSGEPARKHNLALDMRMSKAASFKLTSYFGKDGQNGAVLPVGGTVFKMTHSLQPKLSLITDFTSDLNESTKRQARIIGFGLSGTLSNGAALEVYLGWSQLVENGPKDHDTVFRVKYDYKIDADRYLILTAQKKSAVDRSSINPFEGETTARLDYKTVFH